MQLEPCDLILVSTPGFFGAAIRFFTRRIGEGPSKCNHVAGVLIGGSAETAVIVEALNSGVVERVFRQLIGKGRVIEVWRPSNLNIGEKAGIVTFIARHVGDAYGWGRILAAAADWFLFENVVFRRLCRGPYVCSSLWGAAFASVGKTFGKDAGAITPDDVRDFIKGNPQLYQRVI